MAKRGRPKKENPKNHRYVVRLDSMENQLLSEACEKTGKNKAELIRDTVMSVIKK